MAAPGWKSSCAVLAPPVKNLPEFPLPVLGPNLSIIIPALNCASLRWTIPFARLPGLSWLPGGQFWLWTVDRSTGR